jgi:hypothetical protein
LLSRVGYDWLALRSPAKLGRLSPSRVDQPVLQGAALVLLYRGFRRVPEGRPDV